MCLFHQRYLFLLDEHGAATSGQLSDAGLQVLLSDIRAFDSMTSPVSMSYFGVEWADSSSLNSRALAHYSEENNLWFLMF